MPDVITKNSAPPTTNAISGTITDTGGLPLSGASLYILRGGKPIGPALMTDPNGYYSTLNYPMYRGLPAGRYEIQAALSGYDFPGPAVVILNGTAMYNFTGTEHKGSHGLHTSLDGIRGIVVSEKKADGRNHPVTGIRVFLTSSKKTRVKKATDIKGEFFFRDVKPGNYEFNFLDPLKRYTYNPISFVVKKKSHLPPFIVLPSPLTASVSGFVFSSEEGKKKPLSGIKVSILSDVIGDKSMLTLQTNFAGFFTTAGQHFYQGKKVIQCSDPKNEYTFTPLTIQLKRIPMIVTIIGTRVAKPNEEKKKDEEEKKDKENENKEKKDEQQEDDERKKKKLKEQLNEKEPEEEDVEEEEEFEDEYNNDISDLDEDLEVDASNEADFEEPQEMESPGEGSAEPTEHVHQEFPSEASHASELAEGGEAAEGAMAAGEGATMAGEGAAAGSAVAAEGAAGAAGAASAASGAAAAGAGAAGAGAGAAGGAAAAGGTAAAGGIAAGGWVILLIAAIIFVIVLIIIIIVVIVNGGGDSQKPAETIPIPTGTQQGQQTIPNLTISKTGPAQVDNSYVDDNKTIDYTITVQYSGNLDVTIHDQISSNADITDVSGTPDSKDAHSVVWSLNKNQAAKPSESASYTFTVKAHPTAHDSTVQNSAEADAAGGTGQIPIPQLTITKSGPDNQTLANNSDLTYGISVNYPGTQDVTVFDQLPDGISLKNASPQPSIAGNILSWHLKDLQVTGGKYTFTINAHDDKPNIVAQNKAYATAPSDTGSNAPPNQSNCNGKYILNNPIGNFGDPNCNFTTDQMLAQLQSLDPANAARWFAITACESSHIPNTYASHESIGTPDLGGAWGLFQMGSRFTPGDPGSHSVYDHGDVDWPQQISNAINYNKLINGSFAYWQCAQTN